MNHLRTCIIISCVLHAGFVLSFAHAGGHPAASAVLPRDYHLPIQVELTHRSVAAVQSDGSPFQGTHKIMSASGDLLRNQAVVSKGKTDASARAVEKMQSAPDLKKAQVVQSADKLQIQTPVSSKQVWNQPPHYPDQSRRMGQEGQVVLEVDLNSVGKVIRVQVRKTSGYPLLDESAVKAVSQWSLDSAQGKAKKLFIPITFELNKTSELG